jgi:hypothetical protein
MDAPTALTPVIFDDVRGKTITLSEHFGYPQDRKLACEAPVFDALGRLIDRPQKIMLLQGIIAIVERARVISGQPIVVNSGYRTLDKQAELIKDGYKASEKSPHPCGAAMDVQFQSSHFWGGRYRATSRLAWFLEEAADDLDLKKWLRIGWETYIREKNQFFCHVDFLPMLFDKQFEKITAALPESFYPYGRKNPRPEDWKGGVRW